MENSDINSNEDERKDKTGSSDGFKKVQELAKRSWKMRSVNMRKKSCPEPFQFKRVPQLIRYYEGEKDLESSEQVKLEIISQSSSTISLIQRCIKDNFQCPHITIIDALQISMSRSLNICDIVYKDRETLEIIQKELTDVRNSLKGVKQMQNWCIDQAEHLMDKYISSSNQNIKDHSMKCYVLLPKKINDLDKVLKATTEQQDKITTRSYELQTDLLRNQKTLKTLTTIKSHCIQLLKDRGVPVQVFDADYMKDSIDKLCKNLTDIIDETHPINNRSNWFVDNISMKEASYKLSKKCAGTFLIRQEMDLGTFALDIVIDKSVEHCIILCRDGKYGFIENECYFQNLEELVRTFHIRTLKDYNPKLTSELIFPVNGVNI